MTKIHKKCWYKQIIWVLPTYFILGIIASAHAKDNSTNISNSTFLTITPKRCVALHQGQKCYQELLFKWKVSAQRDYCLYADGVSIPVHCWKNATSGQLAIDFQSNKSILYSLRETGNNIDLLSAEMIVAWVYGNKKRRRASWRLF